jgi:mannose/fructose/N-acetylgalactosamine-specific phosphotransferase system component IIC
VRPLCCASLKLPGAHPQVLAALVDPDPCIGAVPTSAMALSSGSSGSPTSSLHVPVDLASILVTIVIMLEFLVSVRMSLCSTSRCSTTSHLSVHSLERDISTEVHLTLQT